MPVTKEQEGVPGKAPLAGEGVKKYSATIRQTGLCQVRMEITRTVAAPVTVTIERLDSGEHHHDLERSREIAPSTLEVQLATAEAEKGYAAAQVMNVLKGVGTPPALVGQGRYQSDAAPIKVH